MRYWGYLAGKLAAATLVIYLTGRALAAALPDAPPMLQYARHRFGADLSYTIVLFAFGVLSAGVLWTICIDHRYRCRTCLRRLRMPIATGSWTHVLLSRPRTEYICPYGHGTLKVEELQITGHAEPDWQPNEDIWKELQKK